MTQVNQTLFFGEPDGEDTLPYQVFINTKGDIVITDSDFESNDYSSLIAISPDDWRHIVKFIESEITSKVA